MALTEQPPESSAPAGVFDELEDDLPYGQVSELFTTLGKALRAYQLYDENNPVYKRFVSSLVDAFVSLWDEIAKIQISVEESEFKLLGQSVYKGENRNDSLSFLFYKDGVREIVFERGFEDEVERLLGVLQKAKDIRPEADDLLTILWEEDFTHFRYQYVDLMAEGVDLPEPSGEDQSTGLAQAHGEIAEDEEGEEARPGEAAEEDDSEKQGISKEDFNPTLYSLDPRERQQLEAELEAEMNRDLRGDVLSALFDQLENPHRRERQIEILGILRTLLPNFLSRGAVSDAARVLSEIDSIRTMEGVFTDEHHAKVEALLDELSDPETIGELLNALRDGSIEVPPEVLGEFLRYLRADALAGLLRVSEEIEDETLTGTLRTAVRGIAENNADALIDLLDQSDPVVAAGAARLVGELGIEAAGPKLASLMQHSDPGVRLAGIEAAVSLGATSVVSGLATALQDPDRSLRIEAARALGKLGHADGKAPLEEAITGKEIKNADLTEKIAFFEAYGTLGGPDSISLLDKLLNGKSFLGRKEPPEIRACAAMALGVIGNPQARKSLEQAKGDDEVVVRNAVGKALKGGGE